MRSYSRLIAILLIVAISVTWVFAHPGRTDGKGGHTDRSTGEYHYHHGYPAHQHEGGVCPYDFDDQTGVNSGISSGRTTVTKADKDIESYKPSTIVTTTEVEVEVVPFWVYCVFAILLCIVLGLVVDIRHKKNDIDYKNKQLEDKKRIQDDVLSKEQQLKEKDAKIKHLEENARSQTMRIASMQSYVADLIAILEQTRNAPPRDEILDLLGEDFSASDLELPDDVYFIDGFIPVVGRTSPEMPYGDLTVYTAPTGKCYHSNRFCGSGFLRPAHAYDVIWQKSPCANCAKAFPAHPPEWYRRIKYIAKNRTTK